MVAPKRDYLGDTFFRRDIAILVFSRIRASLFVI